MASKEWLAIANFDVFKFVQEYEWRGDGVDYTPNHHERLLMEDCANGIKMAILDALDRPTTPPHSETQTPATTDVVRA